MTKGTDRLSDKGGTVHLNTEHTPIEPPPPMAKQIVVSALLNGQWFISTFNLEDQTWKEAIKAYREQNKYFKITYK